MPLHALSTELRSALLSFYIERNEDVELGDAIHEFLQFVAHWEPEVPQVSTLVPLPDAWVGLSSSLERYTGSLPCAEDFGKPEGGRCWTRLEIQMPDGRVGWLAFWGQGPSPPLPRSSLWKRMEEQMLRRYAYAELHHRYQALVEDAVDAIITIDGRGTMLQFNPGATRMFGYAASEAIGQNVNLLMPPPHSAEHNGHLERYTRTGEKHVIGIGRRLPARRKDGSIFPTHLALTEFKRDGASYYIGTLRDISDLVEARSRASVEERRHLSRELHDSVSQALFGIVIGAQAVKNALHTPEQAREAIDYVLDLAGSGLAEMRTLIFELRPEALESEGLLACLRKQTQALANRYRLAVEVKGISDEPALELALKHELYRVVMESLHNVVKHARASSCTVDFQSLPGEYAVTIHDDGLGFDSASLPPGRVGLSSMRERVAQLGGRMTITSVPGRGTTLQLHLPATNTNQASECSFKAPPGRASQPD